MRKMVFGLMVVGVLLIGANAFAAGDLIVNGKIGIGTTTPVTSLDVNGGIKVGNVTTACSASLNGVLRYTGTAFEFCNGTAWQLLSSGTIPSSDPNTKLLLHMDGTNGSTTFTDSSASAHTITTNGNAQISTSQSKFGGASGYLDGSTNTSLIVSVSNDWNFGTADFTIDFWINTTNSGSAYPLIIEHGGTTSGGWNVRLDANGAVTMVSATGHSWAHDLYSSYTVNDGTWKHIAFVRSSGVLKLYVDGIERASNSNSSDYVLSVDLKMSTPFSGYIDELRISKGIARWTANFTPPTAPY